MIIDRPLSIVVPSVAADFPIIVNIDAQTVDDVKVYYGDNQLAILDSDYGVALAGDFKSFTVTPTTQLVVKANGGAVTIAFDGAIVQPWEIPASPRLPQQDLEKALDRLTLFIRRTRELSTSGMQLNNGVWDAINAKISNLADATEPQDAVPLLQLQALIAQIVSGDYGNAADQITYDGAIPVISSGYTETVYGALETLYVLLEAISTDALSGGQLTGALEYKAGIQVDSAATTDLGAVAGNKVILNGTVTITSFGTGLNKFRLIYHNGIHQLTAGANLVPPGNANKVAAVGDLSCWTSGATGIWRCQYWSNANGRPAAPALLADVGDMSADARTFSAAANFGAMRSALGLGGLAVLGFSGLVYAGNDAANTVYPIGSTVIVINDGTIDRNDAATPRLDAGNDTNYVIGGAGAALSGTWRARGNFPVGDDDGILMQRVA